MTSLRFQKKRKKTARLLFPASALSEPRDVEITVLSPSARRLVVAEAADFSFPKSRQRLRLACESATRDLRFTERPKNHL